MKRYFPTLTTIPRELRDIPNTAGFRLQVIHRNNEQPQPATVAKGEDGCHFLRGETGHRLDIRCFSGWLPA